MIETQLADGSWDETSFTGTGFPRVFYLRYHYYRVYFPLMAIARYQSARGSAFRERRHRYSEAFPPGLFQWVASFRRLLVAGPGRNGCFP